MTEYEIAKVGENIRTTEEHLKKMQLSQEESNNNEKDQACMMSMLEEDFEKELKSRELKLQEHMEKIRRMEVARMEKRIREVMIKTKKQGYVVRTHF